MDKKERLIKLIKDNSFLKSDEPIYLLASGKMSNVYFDLRLTALAPQGQVLIGNLLYEKIQSLGLKPLATGGLTMGADPIACALAYTSELREDPIEAFVIRKEPKVHGRGLQIEGNINKGDDVIIVDDVLTTGGSTLKAIKIAKSLGLNVLCAIVVLDRCEQNGKANVEEVCPLYSLFVADDFK